MLTLPSMAASPYLASVDVRRSIVVALILGILVAPLTAGAQRAGKKPRVGVLMLTPRASVGGAYVDALREGLRELGYREGQTIDLEIGWAEGRADRLADLASRLVGARIDVLVTSGSEAIRAAQRAHGTVPIVMATVADPVGLGVAGSLARPGGRLTGLAILSPELTAKRLQLFREALPSVTRVGLLWNPVNEVNTLMLREAETASRSLGIELQPVPVRAADQIAAAFGTLVERRTGGILMFEDSMLVSHTEQIIRLAAQHRLPTMYPFRSLVDAGGLMSYGPHVLDLWRRAAVYVDKILKGAKPGDLPIEQPTKFELVINLKTAKALGLTIPQSLLVRADEIIQ
jgi:putative ABC transport system substrate-binding protein